MATLGQDLKRERELRAISLNDISSQTKIGLRYLQALEDDRLDLLPGTFFIKSVLRSYSKCIGVDENYFVNKYHEEVLLQKEDQKETERRRADAVLAEPRPKRERRLRFRWWMAAVPLALIAAAAAGVYVYILKPQGDNRPVIPRPAIAPPGEQISPPPVQVPVADPDDPAKAAELRLELTFLAETWIQVAADGQVQMEGIKKAGERAAFTAKQQFLLQTGNAGGFSYTINGRAGIPLGTSGAVRTDIWIHRDNLKDFLAAR